MKLNLPLMQLIIRILILMILFVIIYLISAILYSAKYWPDIYNYINANITIKRIPKISELNTTEIEVFTIDPTDLYTTTEPEFEIEISTIDVFDIDEFTNFEKNTRTRRDIPIVNFGNDYSELPRKEVFIDHMDWIEVKTESNNKYTQAPYRGKEINNSYDDLSNTEHIIDRSTELIINIENNIHFLSNEFDQNYNENNNKKMANDHIKDMIVMYVGKHSDNIDINKNVQSYLMDNNDNNIIDNVVNVTDNIQIDKSNNDLDNGIEGSTINDLIDDTKLTTRTEDVEMVTGDYKLVNQITLNTSHLEEVEPFILWITTIFVVNQTNNFQFDYLCDGILVAENTILTGARCVHRNQTTIDPEDLLIVLGKTSLRTAKDHEKIAKIKHVVVHENFTKGNGKVENDLALLVMEEPVAENIGIQIANISDVDDFDVECEKTATTAWSLSGDITPIYFEENENDLCQHINKVENTICTTYGNDVALCPSYGGLYTAKIEDVWYLQGVFYGDPADRGICFNKSVLYTSLENYLNWIMDTIASY